MLSRRARTLWSASISQRESTLAGSLLTQAIDDAGVDPCEIVEVLDSIPDAFMRTERAIAEIKEGKLIPLSEL